MALNTLPSSPLPDLPIKTQFKHATRRAQFGDGYEQVGTDGANARIITVTLSWSNINQTERDTIVDFLSEHVPHVPFKYVVKGQGAHVFLCDGWTDTEVDAGYFNVSAVLTEFHGATP